MSTRKTITVDKVREIINDALFYSVTERTDARRGMAHVLESILHETGNYHGFSYLTLPPHGADGDYDWDHPDFDASRRRYH